MPTPFRTMQIAIAGGLFLLATGIVVLSMRNTTAQLTNTSQMTFGVGSHYFHCQSPFRFADDGTNAFYIYAFVPEDFLTVFGEADQYHALDKDYLSKGWGGNDPTPSFPANTVYYAEVAVGTLTGSCGGGVGGGIGTTGSQAVCGNGMCEQGEDTVCPACVSATPACKAPCQTGTCPMDCNRLPPAPGGVTAPDPVYPTDR